MRCCLYIHVRVDVLHCSGHVQSATRSPVKLFPQSHLSYNKMTAVCLSRYMSNNTEMFCVLPRMNKAQHLRHQRVTQCFHHHGSISSSYDTHSLRVAHQIPIH
jgi:hypothetical protein